VNRFLNFTDKSDSSCDYRGIGLITVILNGGGCRDRGEDGGRGGSGGEDSGGGSSEDGDFGGGGGGEDCDIDGGWGGEDNCGGKGEDDGGDEGGGGEDGGGVRKGGDEEDELIKIFLHFLMSGTILSSFVFCSLCLHIQYMSHKVFICQLISFHINKNCS